MTDNTTSPPDMPGLFDFICFAIYSANHAFGRTYKPFLDDLGLTYPQYLGLVVLWAEDSQTVGAIGRKLFLESNTLTPLLKRLEAASYIRRDRSSDDERQVLVSPTQEGRALRTRPALVPHCIMDAMGLDLATVTRLRDDIVDLRERLLRDQLSHN